MELSQDEMFQKILDNNPHYEVEIPTGGIVYPKDSYFSGGKVHMRYMLGEDEEILTTPKNLKNVSEAYNTLLKRLILKNGINIEELTQADKNYLVVSARISSLGSDYTVEKVHCPECGETTENFTFDLVDIKEPVMVEKPDNKYLNEFKRTLPATGDQISFMMPTVKTTREIVNMASEKGVNDFTLSAASCIRSTPKFDVDKIDIKKKIAYYRKLPTKDTRYIRDMMKRLSSLTEYKIDYTCPACGEVTEKKLSFDISFFFPEL